MQQITQKLNDLMKQIHDLHGQYENVNKDKVYDDFVELSSPEYEDSQSYQLFDEFQTIIAENGMACLEYFEQCSIEDFVLFVWHHLKTCKDHKFYAALCNIWEKRAPKEPKNLKMDIFYGLWESDASIDNPFNP